MKMTDIIELARLGYKPSDIKELLSMETDKKDPEPDKKDPDDPFEKLAKS